MLWLAISGLSSRGRCVLEESTARAANYFREHLRRPACGASGSRSLIIAKGGPWIIGATPHHISRWHGMMEWGTGTPTTVVRASGLFARLEPRQLLSRAASYYNGIKIFFSAGAVRGDDAEHGL
jgi:hypothetical protein